MLNNLFFLLIATSMKCSECFANGEIELSVKDSVFIFNDRAVLSNFTVSVEYGVVEKATNKLFVLKRAKSCAADKPESGIK